MRVVVDTNVVISALVTRLELVDPVTTVEVCRDPDDDKFIGCAIDSRSPLFHPFQRHSGHLFAFCTGPLRASLSVSSSPSMS